MEGGASSPALISVAMTCFNRREGTLRCLRSLFAQEDDSVRFAVFLVDDGSSDGTGDAVRLEFPQVHVLEGNGSLFWGGGMHMALSEALRHPYDFMLWLNDDVTLKPDAIVGLLAAYARAVRDNGGPAHIIIGAMEDPDSGGITYSGFNRRNTWHPAQVERVNPVSGQLTRCDTLNGNCVLVPASVVEKIGIIDAAFVHQIGDIDYGYRAGRAGIPVWIAPEPAGYCRNNPPGAPWAKPGLTFSQKLKVLLSPRGLPLAPWLRFHARYAGPLAPVLLGASYAKALVGHSAR